MASAHANASVDATSYSIDRVVASGNKSRAFLDLALRDAFSVHVTNRGNVMSDYVALRLLFVSGTSEPGPQPNEQLAAYTRVHGLALNESAVAELNVTLRLGAILREDKSGTYTLALDTTEELKHMFRLVWEAAKIVDRPEDSSTRVEITL